MKCHCEVVFVYISTDACFMQDVRKQREEIERLQALLTQHNIPHDSKAGECEHYSSCTSPYFSMNRCRKGIPL